MSFSAIIASSRKRTGGGIPVFVGAINDLAVTDFTDTTITLDWTTPSADNPIDYFEVWVDNIFYENTTDDTEGWTVTGLTLGTSYNIKLKTVDTLGNKSAFSNAVTQSTTGAGLLLDEVSGFIHAYSHRKLRNAYAGSAIMVRRSSDSTTSDIGFASNELDESALTTFTGANDGFKNKFYDQAGSRDLVQATAANQPKIVNSGTVIKVSGKPYPQYDGIDDFMISSGSATPIMDKDCTVFVVFESQSVNNNRQIFTEINPANTLQAVHINSSTDAVNFAHSNYRPDGTGRLLAFSSQQPISTKRVMIFKRSGNTVEAYDETNILIYSLSSSAVFSVNTELSIARDLAGSIYFGGKIAELLINNTALSPTDQATVINNIKAYYSIT